MSYETLDIARRLRERRIAQNLSQRDLSRLTGVPQAQISRIESGQVDLRFSSLFALASALGLAISLIPRQAVPAVKSVVDLVKNHDGGDQRPAYTLDEDDDV